MTKITNKIKELGLKYYEVHGVFVFETFWIVALKGCLIKIKPAKYPHTYNVTVHKWYGVSRKKKYLWENKVIQLIEDEFLNSLI